MTLPRPYQVTRRHRETPDVVTLTLEPTADPLPAFSPGQFAMVHAFPSGEVPLSLSGTSGSGTTLHHTVRAVGAVTRALCRLCPGEYVGVRGPYGEPWKPAAAGQDLLLVAGGLGLAPLRPLLTTALASRRHGSVGLVVGARAPADLLYREQYPSWATRATVRVTVDRPDEEWTGNVGVVTTQLAHVPHRPRHTTAYVCGPEVMMRATARELVDRGVPASRVFLSLERTMRCGTGHCGQCQLGPVLLCRDGAVLGWDRVGPLLGVREL